MTKKKMFGCFFVLFILLILSILVKYYYFWFLVNYKYFKYNLPSVWVQINNNLIRVIPDNESEWLWARRFTYEIKDNNIYIYIYYTYRLLRNDILLEKNILLSQKWTYKVYYKNPDGTDVFLKEVKYE